MCKQLPSTATLADHAECWAREQGLAVPERGTAAWREMYTGWVEWAFSEFAQ